MQALRADVVVIGGGAAGMMAAGTAAGRGAKVILLEPNKMLGKKLRITGKGRCNITNACQVRDFMKNIPVNPKFLYSSLNGFTPEDTIAFFEEIGVAVKVERGNRVFPVSDSANEVANALERFLHSSGVEVLHASARHIGYAGGAVSAVQTSAGMIDCQNVVIATGGASYPGTGSTGDGYRLARELGHNIIDVRPSLVPLESGAEYCREMQGFSLKNVTLTAFDETGSKLYHEMGEMLFTHFGVSGPLVLSASAHLRDFKNHKYSLSIDLKPALDEKKLDARLLRDFSQFANKDYKNYLGQLVGKTMIPVFARLSGIPDDTKVNSITRQQRKNMIQLLKAFPVPVSGPRPISEAIVTTGGVDVREVNPRTMESKLVSGLYFAGEVLDVDGYTGGFNLQIAWSSGRAAGRSIPVWD